MEQPMDGNFVEQLVRFGQDDKLVGILSRPASGDVGKTALLALNAGALHRAGPCRMSVLMARRYAAAGIPVLRFDFYGIGDSDAVGRAKTGEGNSASRVDVHEALDYLETNLGIERVVVHGLCSGARDAIKAALADPRIVGVSQIDGYAYRNSGYMLQKMKVFLISPAKWVNFIRVRMPGAAEESVAETADIQTPEWDDYPSREEVAGWYSALAERGVRFLVVFTGSWSKEYNYEGQFHDNFPAASLPAQTTLKYMPWANHVLGSAPDRENFLEALGVFLAECSSAG